LAFFDKLDLSGQGATKTAAIENLRAHIQAYCETLQRHSVLEKTLNEKGVEWKRLGGEGEEEQLRQPVLV
jgi:hypothetical protein